MKVSDRDFLRSFARVGLLSFGGPAAQISLMQTELVERRGWLDQRQFLGALSFCMLMPGPEAMQLATYAGWKLRGTLGGLITGLLFVLPGAAVIAALALAYAEWGEVPLVQALFSGIKAAVLVIVTQALWRLAGRALEGRAHWALAIMAFAAIYVGALPFPVIIAAAALWGAWTSRGATPEPPPHASPGQTARTLRTALIWAALWAAPVLAAYWAGATFLTDIALFFSKLAVVTFGGAYAVLAYMTQTVTQTHGWLSTDQMIDALGLAETTPGPLILVTQFVAMLAGFTTGGTGMALLAGALALWVTFVPCFLWIFTGAPYLDRILAQPRLRGALAAISAAVVGVIANLSLWFALHVLFGQIASTPFGAVPVLSSLSWTAAGLTALAALLMAALRIPMLPALALMALTGAAAHWWT
ncbi:chromate efflux transporter [Roseovarius sp. M141]|uniref:chromate efflux transporter n=1 Tax=Roseovarius sp. M141 TaxID=2583806 RepID=UPI0020CE3672|nr:chromate efflux transporter [Roseovarius sp. M141]MCQ0093475.1 chromate efflux transporter [Roseovarius sp. M141]